MISYYGHLSCLSVWVIFFLKFRLRGKILSGLLCSDFVRIPWWFFLSIFDDNKLFVIICSTSSYLGLYVDRQSTSFLGDSLFTFKSFYAISFFRNFTFYSRFFTVRSSSLFFLSAWILSWDNFLIWSDINFAYFSPA